MNVYLFSVTMGLLFLTIAAIYGFPWLRTLKFFWRFLCWFRNNPTPWFMSNVMGLVMLFSGAIANVLGNGQGSGVYWLITMIGAVILIIINWGAPLRREE